MTSMEDCLFCRIARKQIPSTIVYEDEKYVAFHDISPQAPVHILIIPKQHIRSTEELDTANSHVPGEMVLLASRIAKEKKLDGYRLVFNCNEIAGQSVFHIHCHLLAGRPMNWPPG